MHKIRKATKKDIPNICQLLISTWQTCYTSFMPKFFLDSLDLDHQIKRHHRSFDAGVTYFIMENSENELVGFTSLGVNRMNQFDLPYELYTIYVDKNYQGQAIGKQLLQQVFQSLPSSQESLLVSVFAKNPYYGFYIKNGFHKVGEETIELGGVALVCHILCKN